MYYVKAALILLIFFLLLDGLWLGVIANGMYVKAYHPWLRLDGTAIKPVLWAAAIVYLCFVVGMLTFVFPLAKQSIACAFIYGAVFGLVVYGVYDFTAFAVYKDWPLLMSFVDCAWGIVLCSLSAGLSMSVLNILGIQQP